MMASNIQSDLVKIETAILDWTIYNYEILNEKEVRNSQYFCSSKSDCKFGMHFMFETSTTKFYLSSNKNNVQVKCSISILDNLGRKQHTKEYRLICGEGYNNFTESVNYITHKECLITTKSDDLRIYCEVDVLSRKAVFSSQPEIVLVEKSYLVGMQELLEKGDFSDVVLVVGGKDFKAHKAILSARSDVFKAMFMTDLEEKKRNRVEITDISVQVFEHLLLYIYTDIIPEFNSKHTVDLFIAADKYNLPYLKLICEEILIENPLVDSAAHVLLIADMHNAVQLKANYVEYITDNSASVMVTDGWKHLVKARPDLLMELYQDISKKFDKLNIKSL